MFKKYSFVFNEDTGNIWGKGEYIKCCMRCEKNGAVWMKTGSHYI
jgi:hypothetical protein